MELQKNIKFDDYFIIFNVYIYYYYYYYKKYYKKKKTNIMISVELQKNMNCESYFRQKMNTILVNVITKRITYSYYIYSYIIKNEISPS